MACGIFGSSYHLSFPKNKNKPETQRSTPTFERGVMRNEEVAMKGGGTGTDPVACGSHVPDKSVRKADEGEKTQNRTRSLPPSFFVISITLCAFVGV